MTDSNEQDVWQALHKIVLNYSRTVKDELHERWKKWPLDLAKREMYDVIGALLAR